AAGEGQTRARQGAARELRRRRLGRLPPRRGPADRQSRAPASAPARRPARAPCAVDALPAAIPERVGWLREQEIEPRRTRRGAPESNLLFSVFSVTLRVLVSSPLCSSCFESL